ncbi:GAF domain-containing protein [Oculatella sp. LEGE 06141]|uniref:GAF domain-containing protein n=1 Tax=Oculatella sp. LEGE 06141 TaxID=1828648 RepID=UPI001882F432|nr:GAF domain-containing protein [Oculatella sp. LEGE 06141]MBE9182935.1 GAF domain-containing protein [Oculatella sp. LEGE 06141]
MVHQADSTPDVVDDRLSLSTSPTSVAHSSHHETAHPSPAPVDYSLHPDALDLEVSANGVERPLAAADVGGVSLRRQLVTTILPGVLIPLGAAGLLSYVTTTQRAAEQNKKMLEGQAASASETTSQLLQDALKLPTIVATDPAVIEFARNSSQAAATAGIPQVPTAQLEQRFSATKLLRPNPPLNDYLRRTADIGQFDELLITEQHGFNVAYNRPTARFVQQNQSWWQRAKTDLAPVVELHVDPATQSASVNLVHAIVAPNSREFWGVARGKISMDYFNQALQRLGQADLSQTEQVQLVAPSGDGDLVTIASIGSESDTSATALDDTVQQQVSALLQQRQFQPTDPTGDRSLVTTLTQNGKHYALSTVPGTNWVAIASVNETSGIAGDRELALTFTAIFLLLGAMTSGVILLVAKRLSHPIDQLSHTVEQVSAGNLNLFTEPRGSRETRQLATRFNYLVSQVNTSLQQQSAALQRAQLLSNITTAANQGNHHDVFALAVQAAKSQLQADRVVIYAFEADWSGSIVAEAVEPEWPQALGNQITDACIPKSILEEYSQGRIAATREVQATNYSPAHKQLLEQLEVKASLIVPIVSGGVLLGLLVAHQCSGLRDWQEDEVTYLRELASQVGLALTGITLLARKAAEVERAQILKDVTLRIRQSVNVEDILQLSADEVRRVMKTDRALIYQFNPDWQSGVVVAEAVKGGWTKAFGQVIHNPLTEGDLDRYHGGTVWSSKDTQNDAISDRHYAALERLQVKAVIAAPIFRNGQLYGLLCGHHCATPRQWLETEADLLTQLAVQVGFALDQADLLEKQAAAAKQARQLSEITAQVRETLQPAQIFSAAVNGVRQALETDRTLVYLFGHQWQGKVVSESVADDWSSVLETTIPVPHFAARYIEHYQSGRIQTLTTIEEASLTDCYMGGFAPFEVKANLVAPILVGKRLVALLVAHHCSEPRQWQEADVTFFRQVATQVGFALDQVTVLKQQADEAKRARQINEITSRMRESSDRSQMYGIVTRALRQTLKVDRAIVYLFDAHWNGKVVAESVAEGWPTALKASIADPCFAQSYVEKYRQGRVQAVRNIYEANLDPCYLGQLEPFQVKASVVAPIVMSDRLLGLLVVHQCSGTRSWRESEINFLRQVAIQLGFALEQVQLLEQREQSRIAAEALLQEQRQQKEAIQQQLIKLLEEVEGASRGDLTVRAEVTVGEIGTVADFFNSIVESLHQIVLNVKHSAYQVNASLISSEKATRSLAEDAQQQAEETTRTLGSVEEMTLSIQEVASRAIRAADVARSASSTARASGTAMDLTVQNILSLRETIGETAKKVKRLGESSQQISRVVSLINQIALQTNLLAINAGIEAARAGEEGQGFAVVAEEVGELAARSAAATQEIEYIVETIQRETSKVVEAMELGTTQVVEGTQLVGEAKTSLNRILEVSDEIDGLVQSISEATVSQVQTSNAVTSLMKEIARVSAHTSNASLQVSSSLRQTVDIAQELQASMGTFKVNAEA